MIKKATRAALARLGYELRRSEPAGRADGGLARSMSDVLALASRLGVQPATVIDVGVAAGTPELYRAFPQAALVLVEPLEEFAESCAAALASRRGVSVLAAAGPADGTATLNVHVDHLDGSSLFPETMGPGFDGRQRPISTVRIDTVVRESGFQGPFVLKVDVQGAELEVLDGAPRTLLDCQLVLLEVSLYEFMRGAPQLGDVVGYMADRAFSVFDIFGGIFRPLDGALGQIDIAFAQDDSHLRSSHCWAATEGIAP